MADKLTDVIARHQHFVERYKTGEVNKIDPFLRRIELDLINRLGGQNTFRSRERILAQLDAIYKFSLAELSTYIDQSEINMVEFGVSQAAFTAKSLSATQGALFSEPSIRQIRAAAFSRPFTTVLLKDSLNDYSKAQARLIRNKVALGFAEGLTNQQIIQSVIGTAELNFKDGSLNVTRNAASRLVRTANQHMASSAQLATYEANSDLIDEYMWLSTLDNRTSSTCQSRDGKVYKVGKGPLPPAHPNCRSTTAPVFDDEVFTDDEGIRRSMTDGMRPEVSADKRGRTSAKTNYNEWLSRQPRSFQVEVLGESKTKLFRQGGLTVDNFVDRLDKPLTVDELRLKFPKEWGKAGI